MNIAVTDTKCESISATQPHTCMRLTQAQCDAFWRDGFLALDQITTPADLADVGTFYDRLFEERAGWKDGNYFDLVGSEDDPSKFTIPHLQNCSRYCPELMETIYWSNAYSIASQLLGGKIKHLYDIAITKLPHNAAKTPWHQDCAFLPEGSYFEKVVFWMPLQAVDESNGCMRFMPGSHRGPIVPHRSPGGDNRVNGLEAIGISDADSIACPLPAGGATVHHHRTLHATGGNNSDVPRRVMTIGWGARRLSKTVEGNFDWLTAKDNQRLRRYRTESAIQKAKKTAAPLINRIMYSLGR
jgi:hypothetical protein